MPRKPSPKDQGLIKISELARRADVSVPTVKHYLREGLLNEPSLRTGRNMSWYDPSEVTRIQRIKALQRTQFLPLKVIKDILDGQAESETEGEVDVRSVVSLMGELTLAHAAGPIPEEVDPADLDWLLRMELIRPETIDGAPHVEAEDMALIQTLVQARSQGITTAMLPPTVLGPYVEAVRHLVRLEVQMFRFGIFPTAGDNRDRLTRTAIRISESLVVLLRRKLIVPTLESMLEDDG